jgi:hypothetical protein
MARKSPEPNLPCHPPWMVGSLTGEAAAVVAVGTAPALPLSPGGDLNSGDTPRLGRQRGWSNGRGQRSCRRGRLLASHQGRAELDLATPSSEPSWQRSAPTLIVGSVMWYGRIIPTWASSARRFLRWGSAIEIAAATFVWAANSTSVGNRRDGLSNCQATEFRL